MAGPDALRLAHRRALSRARATEVITAATEVMRSALGQGGTSFDALYVNVNGSSGYFDRSLAVYGREGQPCPRCGTPIRREPFMNRSSYRCPRCQRAPRRGSVDADPGRSRARSRLGRVEAMERLKHYVFVRHGHNWGLLFRFGVVGFSGVFVNLLVTIICNKLGPDAESIFLGLPLTDFNVRWYHVFSTIAFLVANLWNFQLNRLWTFRSAKHSGWLREYLPFLTVGLLAQVVGLGILTLLMHPNSPLSLPPEIFDNSTGFRTRLYWAQLITIAVVTPISFVLNKIWTFSAVRGRDERGRVGHGGARPASTPGSA